MGQVDLNLARINGGRNDFENLQPLCQPCHHAKTRQDAPWTANGIYAKPKVKVRQQADESELFPDTG